MLHIKNKYPLRRLLSVITAAFCLAAVLSPCTRAENDDTYESPSQIGVTDGTASEYITDYSFIAENEIGRLYADLKNGHIALQNKQSGTFWYSVPNDFLTDDITLGEKRLNVFSELVVGYVTSAEESTANDVSTLNSHTDCVRNGTVKTEKTQDGLCVEYTFVTIDTSVTVEYRLTDDGLSVQIPLGKIKEGEDIILVNISLLPFFGAGGRDDAGYLFVPDGCGAVIDFNNQVETVAGYQSYVYGDELSKQTDTKESNTETVHMPVFGIKRNDDALFAIITSGDGMASINAQNGHSEMGYNSVWSQAELAVISQMSLYEDDWQNRTVISKAASCDKELDTYAVLYTMLCGDNADYVGMADRYRSYLIREKGLEKTKSKSALALTLYGAADKQAYFIGIPYTKLVALTTFSQAQNMLEQLHEDGIEDIAVQYIGWDEGGILNQKLPNKTAALGKLGGKKGIKAFSDYMEQVGDELYLDIDFIRFRKSGNGYIKNLSASKNAFGYTAKQYEYMRSIYLQNNSFNEYFLLSPNRLDKLSQKLLKSYLKLDMEGVSLSAAGQLYYSDFDESNGVYRSDLAEIYEKILSSYASSGFKTAFTQANAYAFGYADRIYSAPTSSSGYYMFDRDVPFYQIVLRGYVNLTTRPITSSVHRNAAFLNAVETGSELLFDGIYEDSSVLSGSRYDYLYSTAFELWRDTAAELNGKLEPLLEGIEGCVITEHERVGDIAHTVYDNGVEVYVNYSDTDVTYGGQVIPAQDFSVIGMEIS